MSVSASDSTAYITSSKDEFSKIVNDMQASLRKQIDQIKNDQTPTADQNLLIEQCSVDISNLTNEVKNASSGLSAYDRRTYSTLIKTLNEQFQIARSAAAPRRRFAFKNAKNAMKDGNLDGRALTKDFLPTPVASKIMTAPQSLTPSTSSDTVSSQPESEKGDVLIQVNSSIAGHASEPINASSTLTVSSLSQSHHVLRLSDLRAAVSIINIQNSLVDLSVAMTLHNTFSTMSINIVADSLLIGGHIRGAAHITKVENSTLVLWSQQVRMHECNDCVVYLRCSSKPIIEDCHGIKFAPLPKFFDGLLGNPPETPFPNYWDRVEDFKWMKAGPSPNWSVLQSEDARAIDDASWDSILNDMSSASELGDRLKATTIVPSERN